MAKLVNGVTQKTQNPLQPTILSTLLGIFGLKRKTRFSRNFTDEIFQKNNFLNQVYVANRIKEKTRTAYFLRLNFGSGEL